MAHKGLARFFRNGLHQFFGEVLEISAFSNHRFTIPVPTICLKDLRVNKDKIVADHVWISGRSMAQDVPFPISLEKGQTVKLLAGVDYYDKGRSHRGKDYGLTSIKYIVVIEKVSNDV